MAAVLEAIVEDPKLLEQVDLRSRRHARRDGRRIDLVVEHRQIAPLGRKKNPLLRVWIIHRS